MKFKNGLFNYETSTATALLNAYGANRAERMVVDVDYICNMITSDLLDRHFRNSSCKLSTQSLGCKTLHSYKDLNPFLLCPEQRKARVTTACSEKHCGTEGVN